MNKLYHRDLGFPITFKYPSIEAELEWGKHALEQAMADRYGIIDTIGKLHTDDYIPIEIEYDTDRSVVVKMVLRSKQAYHGSNACIVVMPRKLSWFVKTVWYNRVDDTHKTLDASKYSIPAFKLKKSID